MTVTPNPASAAADTTADALETTRKLLGEPRIVVLSRGRKVPVHGYRFAQLFAVLSAAQPIFDAVASRPNEPLMQVVGDHREAVIRLVKKKAMAPAIRNIKALRLISVARNPEISWFSSLCEFR